MTVVDMSPLELPALRFHQLRRMGQSPAHYRAAIEQGDPAPSGTALHSVLLGGKRIAKWDRTTDAGKSAPRNGQYWEAFKRDNPDALVLTPSEFAEADGMVRAVRACPEAMRVLEGVHEETLYWTDALGRRCRTTPDVRADEYETELKSTRSADPRRFMWDALRLCYHSQHAWHRRGIDATQAKPVEASFTVAVENSPPYVVQVYRLTERAIEAGRRTIALWLEQLQACEESDVWPGYSQCVLPLDVPERDGELFEEAA